MRLDSRSREKLILLQSNRQRRELTRRGRIAEARFVDRILGIPSPPPVSNPLQEKPSNKRRSEIRKFLGRYPAGEDPEELEAIEKEHKFYRNRKKSLPGTPEDIEDRERKARMSHALMKFRLRDRRKRPLRIVRTRRDIIPRGDQE